MGRELDDMFADRVRALFPKREITLSQWVGLVRGALLVDDSWSPKIVVDKQLGTWRKDGSEDEQGIAIRIEVEVDSASWCIWHYDSLLPEDPIDTLPNGIREGNILGYDIVSYPLDASDAVKRALEAWDQMKTSYKFVGD